MVGKRRRKEVRTVNMQPVPVEGKARATTSYSEEGGELWESKPRR